MARGLIKSRKKMRRSGLKGSVKIYDKATDSPVFEYLMGEGLEAITEELIIELIADGRSEEDLRRLQSEGMEYCRERDSFFSAPFGDIPDGLFED